MKKTVSPPASAGGWKHPDQFEEDSCKQREALTLHVAKSNAPILRALPTSTLPSDAEREWDWQVVALSAKSRSELQDRKKALLDYAKANPKTRLVDLAFSTTAGRVTHDAVREAYVVDSLQGLELQLAQSIEAAESTDLSSDHATSPPKKHRAVFYCSGQVNEYAGMGGELFRQHKGFSERLIAADASVRELGLPGFLDIITDASVDLTQFHTRVVQMALVALEIATAQTLISFGISPSVSMGHSMGEYASLCISGVLSFTDTLLLVNHRAIETVRLIRPNVHAILICWMPVEEVIKAWISLGVSLSVTSINAPNHCTIGGLTTDIKILGSFLEKEGKKTRLLNLKYAFHTAQMAPLLTTVREFAEKNATFRPPTVCEMASTVTGQIHTTSSSPIGPQHIVRQVRDTVDLVGAIESIKQRHMRGGNDDLFWVEVGPTPSGVKLISMNLAVVPEDRLLSAFKPRERNSLTVSHVVKRAYEMGTDINWDEFYGPQAGEPKFLDLTMC